VSLREGLVAALVLATCLSIACADVAPRPGLVYCSESFFPGWTVHVNGRPGRIVPANAAFRAVEVPAGPVTLEFAYWPPGLTAGLAVSGTSAGLVGWLAVAGRRRRPSPAAAGRAEAG
jgi:hypothetical protein